MNPITRLFNLDNVAHAREFLDSLYFDGKKVGSVTVTSGREITFKQMTDSEVCFYAKELYSMQSSKKWRGMDAKRNKD